MYLTTKPTRTFLSVASGLLCLVMVMGLIGGGSTTVTERITDDSGFRRAMLQSSPVFTFESTEVAISHWASLWDCSAGLDRRTHDARQSLLIHAIEPLLDGASSESLTPIRTLRDALESTMDDHTQRGITATRETCDWIVLNNLLGENERTLQWMARHGKSAERRMLPKRVRQMVRSQLGNSISRDTRGRKPSVNS